MKCYIVKDLLPNYIDGLNNEETNADIQNHLADCADCRRVYEKMTVELTQKSDLKGQNIDFLKKLKAATLRKNVIVAISTCLLVLAVFGGLFAYLFFYETPIPFDEQRMGIEVVQTIVSRNDAYSLECDMYGCCDMYGWDFRPMDAYGPGEGEFVIDELMRTVNFLQHRTLTHARSINRDGEDVLVVFYLYTRKPFLRILEHRSSIDFRPTSNHIDHSMVLHGVLEPRMVEVYYLPKLRSIDNIIQMLSDAEFDALRAEGVYHWSGVIGRVCGQ